MKTLFVMAAVAFFLSQGVWATNQETFSFTALTGQNWQKTEHVTLATWRDQQVLGTFWRSDCLPCLKELSILPEIAKQYHDTPMLLISLQNGAHTQMHVPMMPANVHVLVVENDGREILSAFGNKRTLALPYSFMLSREHKICGKYYGIINPTLIQEWLKQC